MEKVEWKVEGMTCANCALTISKYLEKKGQHEVRVSLGDGTLQFELGDQAEKKQLIQGIEDLGYHVNTLTDMAAPKEKTFSFFLGKFFFCLPFTAALFLHMAPPPFHWHVLMNPWLQLLLCLPVYVTGMNYFGKSAWKSLRNGMPNMNVLIALGATAAFLYSLVGCVFRLGPDFLFFETTATIITLVFLGYWLEEVSMAKTQKALRALGREQKLMANMIAFDDKHQEQVFPIENLQLRVGDLILIRAGEQVPMDCKILWGECEVNESIITGESMPIEKRAKDHLIGSSFLGDGTVKAQVTAVGKDSILSRILELARKAQGEKPPIQQFADKISAVFVPVVLVIALLTLLINYFGFHISLGQSLLRGVAVLVIACPCAMGLATPAAIAVGLGRGAKNGILFRDAKTLELFRKIRQIVFDKTGTLTTGQFKITGHGITNHVSEEEFKRIAYSLEKYSSHPIGKCIAREWQDSQAMKWSDMQSVSGKGMEAHDNNNNRYRIGSYGWAASFTNDDSHDAYLFRNDEWLGWIDVRDEIRPEAASVIKYFKEKNIKTILLSGDSARKCNWLAGVLGIEEVHAEKSPGEKLQIVARLNEESLTAMVGDGINDAPAMAKAAIGISVSEASQIAVQNAQVVLMNKGLTNLPLSVGLGKYTFGTIRSNLFWAFIYNIVAIPIAACGWLSPGIAALAMGFSDVVLALNSMRLYVKKLP